MRVPPGKKKLNNSGEGQTESIYESASYYQQLLSANSEALAVAGFEGENSKTGILRDLDTASGGAVTTALEQHGFRGKVGDTAFMRIGKAQLNVVKTHL